MYVNQYYIVLFFKLLCRLFDYSLFRYYRRKISGVILFELTLTEARKVCLKRDLPTAGSKADLLVQIEESPTTIDLLLLLCDHNCFILKGDTYKREYIKT